MVPEIETADNPDDDKKADQRPVRIIGQTARLLDLLWDLQLASEKRGVTFAGCGQAPRPFCYASQRFFADILDVTPRSVRTHVKKLWDANLIDIEYLRDNPELAKRVDQFVREGLIKKHFGYEGAVYFVKFDPKRIDEQTELRPAGTPRRSKRERADQPTMFELDRRTEPPADEPVRDHRKEPSCGSDLGRNQRKESSAAPSAAPSYAPSAAPSAGLARAPLEEQSIHLPQHQHQGGGDGVGGVVIDGRVGEKEKLLEDVGMDQPKRGQLAKLDMALIVVAIAWWRSKGTTGIGHLVCILEDPAHYGFSKDAGQWQAPPAPNGSYGGLDTTAHRFRDPQSADPGGWAMQWAAKKENSGLAEFMAAGGGPDEEHHGSRK